MKSGIWVSMLALLVGSFLLAGCGPSLPGVDNPAGTDPDSNSALQTPFVPTGGQGAAAPATLSATRAFAVSGDDGQKRVELSLALMPDDKNAYQWVISEVLDRDLKRLASWSGSTMVLEPNINPADFCPLPADKGDWYGTLAVAADGLTATYEAPEPVTKGFIVVVAVLASVPSAPNAKAVAGKTVAAEIPIQVDELNPGELTVTMMPPDPAYVTYQPTTGTAKDKTTLRAEIKGGTRFGDTAPAYTVTWYAVDDKGAETLLTGDASLTVKDAQTDPFTYVTSYEWTLSAAPSQAFQDFKVLATDAEGKTKPGFVRVNTASPPKITAGISNTNLHQGNNPFTLSVQVDQQGHGGLTYKWEKDSDSSIVDDLLGTTGPNVTYRFVSGAIGAKVKFTVTVTDLGGNTVQATVAATVPNATPPPPSGPGGTALNVTIAGAPGAVGTTSTLGLEALPTGGKEPYAYKWTCQAKTADNKAIPAPSTFWGFLDPDTDEKDTGKTPIWTAPPVDGSATLSVTVTDSDGGTKTASVTLSIVKPAVQFEDLSADVVEPSSGEIRRGVRVKLVWPGGGAITQDIEVEVLDRETGTATAVSDYVAVGTKLLRFPRSSSSGTMIDTPDGVSIKADAIPESPETIRLALRSQTRPPISSNPNEFLATPVEAEIGAVGEHTITITDNTLPTLSLDIPAGTEGESKIGKVGRNGPTTAAVIATLSVDVDHAADLSLPQTVTIPAGAVEATFNVAYVIDGIPENPETATARAEATGHNPTTADVTVTNNDKPTLTLEIPAGTEGESKIGKVSRNGPTNNAVVATLSVDVGHAGDLTVPATATIPAGASEATFNVTYVADGIVEGSEQATVTASNAGCLDGTAQVSVTDLDKAGVLFGAAAGKMTVGEAIGTVQVEVKLSLPGAGATLPLPVIVYVHDTGYAGGGHATAGIDYVALSPAGVPVTFVAGSPNGSVQTVPVAIIPNNLVDGSRKLVLGFLGAPQGPAGIASPSTCDLTITDDDGAPTVLLVEARTSQTIDVTFSKAMKDDGADNDKKAGFQGNYTLSGAGKGSLGDHPATATRLGSTNTYRLTWTEGEMKAGQTVAIEVAATVTDSFGNAMGNPRSGAHLNGGIGAPPTAVLSDNHPDATVRHGDVVTITATFTENDQVSESPAPRITIGSLVPATAMAKVSNTVWSYTWTVPNSPEQASAAVSIAAADRAGNPNEPPTGKTTYTLDNKAPVAIVSTTASDPTKASPIPFAVDFGEEVKNFDALDIAVTNGSVTVASLSDDGGGKFSFLITPAGDGLVTARVPDNACTDIAGNKNAGGEKSVQYDHTPPTAGITPVTDRTSLTVIAFAIDFGEKMQGFGQGKLTKSRGNIKSFAIVDEDKGQYGVEIELDSIEAAKDEPVTIEVPDDACADVAGNKNKTGKRSVTYLAKRVADFDSDADVDNDDSKHFQACFNGSSSGAVCSDADLAEPKDGVVDGSDFAVFGACLNGSGQDPKPGCPKQ